MKKHLLVYALFALAFSANGQNKINPAGMQLLESYKLELSREQNSNKLLAPAQTPRQDMLVKLAPGADASVLEEYGFDTYSQIDDIYAGSLPIGNIEEMAARKEVQCIEFGVEYELNMEIARPACSVDEIQSGFEYNGSTHSYTGKGVIAGMMDLGLQANHVNFINSDGESRIQRLWHFTGTMGNTSRRVYYPDNMYEFDCDTKKESHATHVAGIMAGSYNGPGTFYRNLSPTEVGRTLYKDEPVPFYGIATDADLAFAVGSLTNANIIAGISNVIDYSTTVGKPAVMNLSLGSTYGAHDGTDLVGQAMEKYGKQAIICIASGNDATAALYVDKTFTATDNTLKVQFKDNKADGIVDFWGNNAEPFTFQWAVYNEGTRTLETIAEVPESGTININSSNSIFAKYFSGSIKVTSSVSANNNRYNVYSDCTNVVGKSSTARLAIVITGNAGQTAYGYSQTDTQFRSDLFITGWTPGSTDNSINDMACGKNVIVVGSFDSKTRWKTLTNSTLYIPNAKVGEISSFSSYGMNFQGDMLPNICAPGCAIISSANRNWMLSQSSSERVASATSPLDNQTDFWVEMQGTSMATPYVSGVIALWLEACPTLTRDQVMDVLEHTAAVDIPVENAPEKFGYGKIDAVAGLKYILDNFASVGSIVDDSKALIVEAVDGGYSVFVGGEQAIAASLYDLQGRMVTSVSANDNELIVPTADLSSGVYVLKVQGANASYTRKVSVK